MDLQTACSTVLNLGCTIEMWMLAPMLYKMRESLLFENLDSAPYVHMSVLDVAAGMSSVVSHMIFGSLVDRNKNNHKYVIALVFMKALMRATCALWSYSSENFVYFCLARALSHLCFTDGREFAGFISDEGGITASTKQQSTFLIEVGSTILLSGLVTHYFGFHYVFLIVSVLWVLGALLCAVFYVAYKKKETKILSSVTVAGNNIRTSSQQTQRRANENFAQKISLIFSARFFQSKIAILICNNIVIGALVFWCFEIFRYGFDIRDHVYAVVLVSIAFIICGPLGSVRGTITTLFKGGEDSVEGRLHVLRSVRYKEFIFVVGFGSLGFVDRTKVPKALIWIVICFLLYAHGFSNMLFRNSFTATCAPRLRSAASTLSSIFIASSSLLGVAIFGLVLQFSSERVVFTTKDSLNITNSSERYTCLNLNESTGEFEACYDTTSGYLLCIQIFAVISFVTLCLAQIRLSDFLKEERLRKEKNIPSSFTILSQHELVNMGVIKDNNGNLGKEKMAAMHERLNKITKPIFEKFAEVGQDIVFQDMVSDLVYDATKKACDVVIDMFERDEETKAWLNMVKGHALHIWVNDICSDHLNTEPGEPAKVDELIRIIHGNVLVYTDPELRRKLPHKVLASSRVFQIVLQCMWNFYLAKYGIISKTIPKSSSKITAPWIQRAFGTNPYISSGEVFLNLLRLCGVKNFDENVVNPKIISRDLKTLTGGKVACTCLATLDVDLGVPGKERVQCEAIVKIGDVSNIKLVISGVLVAFASSELETYRYLESEFAKPLRKKVRIPHFYGGYACERTGNYAFVLERIGVLGANGHFAEPPRAKKNTMTHQQMKDSLEMMAKWHAFHWDNEEFFEKTDFGRYVTTPSEKTWFFQSIYCAAWPYYRDKLAAVDGYNWAPGLMELANALLNPTFFRVVMDIVSQPPLSVCHGDLKPENIFFVDDDPESRKAAGGHKVALIDFAMAHKARGPGELGSLLWRSLKSKDLRASYSEYLDVYHNTLLSEGVKYTREEVKRDMSVGAVACFAFHVACCGVLGSDDATEAERLEWKHGHNTLNYCMNDFRTPEIVYRLLGMDVNWEYTGEYKFYAWQSEGPSGYDPLLRGSDVTANKIDFKSNTNKVASRRTSQDLSTKDIRFRKDKSITLNRISSQVYSMAHKTWNESMQGKGKKKKTQAFLPSYEKPI